MKCSLYRVVHCASGKSYVGISVDPLRRWRNHVSAAVGGRTMFHRAIAKYGAAAFKFRIVAWCSCFEGAQALERVAIHLGLGDYNMTAGGEGTLGYRHTLADKQKMSSKHVGMLHTESTKATIGDRLRSRPKSRHHMTKATTAAALVNKGKKQSPEHVAKRMARYKK